MYMIRRLQVALTHHYSAHCQSEVEGGGEVEVPRLQDHMVVQGCAVRALSGGSKGESPV